MKEPNFEFSRDRGGFSRNGFTVRISRKTEREIIISKNLNYIQTYYIIQDRS